MTYDYRAERARVFTEDGQIMFLAIRDKVQSLTNTAGACTVTKAIAGQSGDTWQMLACIDRLAELGEITIIKNPNGMTQHNLIMRAV